MRALRNLLTGVFDPATDSATASRNFLVLWLGYFGFVMALLLAGDHFEIIHLRYPHIVDDEPLEHPVLVARVEGSRLILGDGRSIEVVDHPDPFEEVDPNQPDSLTRVLNGQMRQSGYMIDVESRPDGRVAVHARQRRWICGTGLMMWRRRMIPLVPETIYENHRKLVAIGQVVASARNEPNRP